MHASSYRHMERLVQGHLPDRPLRILDFGSRDINGCYRPLFERPSWQYVGIDLEAGANVDVVLSDPYRLPFRSRSADVVISGQALEHVEYFWLSWLEISRVVRPDGWVILVAPSRGPEHRYPVDCWRFYPDAYRALARYGGFRLLEVSTDWTPDPDLESAAWGDTIGVFRRLRHRPLAALAARLVTMLERRFLLDAVSPDHGSAE